MKEIPIYNRINLIIDKQELDYLILIVEDNLKYNKAFMDMDSETFMDMLHNLYSKLVILNK